LDCAGACKSCAQTNPRRTKATKLPQHIIARVRILSADGAAPTGIRRQIGADQGSAGSNLT